MFTSVNIHKFGVVLYFEVQKWKFGKVALNDLYVL